MEAVWDAGPETEVDTWEDAKVATGMASEMGGRGMVSMGSEVDIAAIRERMLAGAEIAPTSGRSRADSKAAIVRSLMDVVLAYRARFPKATNMDLLRLLNDAGADVKLDTLRKVLKEPEYAPDKTTKRKQKRKQSGPLIRTPISHQDPDPPTALVTAEVLEDLKDADVKPDDTQPRDADPVRPSAPSSEWLTADDILHSSAPADADD